LLNNHSIDDMIQQPGSKLVDFLSMRDVGMRIPGAPQTTACYADVIGDIMESSFCKDNASFDFPIIPSKVLSTIAIALSPSGETVATTHGDHTVKIHDYESGEVKQVFVGHPRTPWTVKYHPYNANIIASGCLGFDVRVWDLIAGSQLTTIRYDFSIISLSFHPFLPILAVASGPKLHIFNWQTNLSKQRVEAIDEATEQFRNSRNHSVETSGYAEQEAREDTKSPTSVLSGASVPLAPTRYHVLQHVRNIRAVLFHPSGKYLLTAAPDPPKANGTFTACRLYFYSVDSLRVGSDASRSLLTSAVLPRMGQSPGRETESEHREPLFDSCGNEVLQLVRMPYMLEQIHLYSDGGLDISEDGQYLFTCSILPEGVMGGAFGTDSPRGRGGSFMGFGRPGKRTGDSVSNTKRSFDQLLLTNPTPPRPPVGGGAAPGTGFSSLIQDSAAVVSASKGRGQGTFPQTPAGQTADQRFPLPSEFQLGGDRRPTSAVPHQNVRRFPHLIDTHVTWPPMPPGNTTNFPAFGSGGDDMEQDDDDDDDDDFDDDDGADDDVDRGGSGMWTTASGNSGDGAPTGRAALQLPPNTAGQKETSRDQQRQSPQQQPQRQDGSKQDCALRSPVKTSDYLCLFKMANIKTYTSEAADRGRVAYSSFVNSSSPSAERDDSFVLSPIVAVLCAAKPLPGTVQ
jgi:hypothetical protein